MSTIPQQPGSGSQAIALISQLRQQMPNMQHIDDVFLWLSQTIVHQWQIPLIQFWATQSYTTGELRLELRTTASQSPVLPFEVHANQHIADVVKRLLREKRSTMPVPTANIFASSQVETLAYYDLHYWVGYFVGNTRLLPPRKEAAREKTATPLCMLISLFLSQPPSERLGRAVNFAFQHGFVIAANQGFLTTPNDIIKPDISVDSTRQHVQLTLATLVPHRSENIEEVSTENPFANATILPDKKTRRLYSLINGQRDIAALAQLAQLDLREVEETMQFLLRQEKIQLHNSSGDAVNASLVLKNF